VIRIPILILVIAWLLLAEVLRRCARHFQRESETFDTNMRELVARAHTIVQEYDKMRNSFR
jgi:hypothetical protein